MLFLKNDLLYYLKHLDIGGFLMKLIRYLFLIIDGIIYNFISSCYEMFTFMSQIRIFESEDMQNLANRIYILVGVVAMFFVAYALICAIINPENATKGKNNSLTGIVKNIIFAVIGVAIVPTIFTYAYDFQRVVLCSNLIEKLFLENSTAKETENAIPGRQLELYLFKSFYYITGLEDETAVDITKTDENGQVESLWDIEAKNIMNYNNDKSLYQAFQDIETGKGGIAEELNGFDVSISDGDINYLFLLSTVAGLYCVYVLLGFVIDMGVRSVKLAYLQLIAPIPIFSTIIPGQKKIFDNWFKKTKNCFLEVFIRVIAMSFAFYAIKYLRPWIFNGGMDEVGCGTGISGLVKLLAQAVYILGVFAFLKQLPKFVSDLFGIDSKGFKLGLGNAFAEAGGFQALGVAGGFAGAALNYGAGAVRNIGRGWKAVGDAYNYGKQNGTVAGLKKLGRSSITGVKNVASGIADMPRVAKAGYYGYKNTENAKSIEEVKSGATSGVEQAMNEEGVISKVTGIAKEDFKGIKDIATTEYGGANRFDSKKELKKASEMDSIKSIIDSMKSTSDAINATKIKNLEQLNKTEVDQITEQYKKDMAAAANITDDATRIAEENKARDKARTAIARAQDALDVEKRNIQSETFKGNNVQIVEYRKKLANAISDNYDLVKEAMSIANSNQEYIGRASNKLFVENILNGKADVFDDVEIDGKMKKSVVLELGTNLNTASTQKKTAAVEQPKKKDSK